ncbi:hypothetical protein EYF80_033013 [Liparis tanakae]|uniref:Uncharacterized protein n=1 Tax=Liparis tanakae TaxID=230148 RepID=A0A4Z2GUC9_9TELE|nr:hypothetical protein EYF80_033013 [Liparis tanakae]
MDALRCNGSCPGTPDPETQVTGMNTTNAQRHITNTKKAFHHSDSDRPGVSSQATGQEDTLNSCTGSAEKQRAWLPSISIGCGGNYETPCDQWGGSSGTRVLYRGRGNDRVGLHVRDRQQSSGPGGEPHPCCPGRGLLRLGIRQLTAGSWGHIAKHDGRLLELGQGLMLDLEQRDLVWIRA